MQGWIENVTYLACSFAKPLWASIKGLMPGKRVAANGSKSTSTSVAMDALGTYQRSCQSFIEVIYKGIQRTS